MAASTLSRSRPSKKTFKCGRAADTTRLANNPAAFRAQILDPRHLFFSPMKASIAKRPALRGVSRSADSPTQVLLFDLVDEE
jgi:hypothetical protein